MRKLPVSLIIIASLFISNNVSAEVQNYESKTQIKSIKENNNSIDIDNIWKVYNNKNTINDLFFVTSNRKFGIINEKGDIVIPLKYNLIIKPYFDDDTFILKEAENLNLVNKKGELLIKDNFKSLISVDKNIFSFSKNGKDFGLIDSNGKIILEAKFQDIKIINYEKKIYKAKYNGKYGLIDSKGKFIVKNKFEDVYGFSDDMIIFLEKKKFGFANKDGEIIVKPRYDSMTIFKDGFASFKENKKWGLINNKGKIIFKPSENYFFNFGNDVLISEKNSKYGVIDKNGKVVIDYKYDKISFFLDKVTTMVLNKKYGLINNKGKVIVEPKFDYLDTFGFKEITKFEINKKYGLINNEGKIILAPKYDEITTFYTSFSIVKLNKKYGLIDKNGKEIVSLKYDSLDFFDDILVTNINGKYGAINMNDHTLLEAKYDEVKPLSKTVFVVSENKLSYFINTKLNIKKKITVNFMNPELEKSTRVNMHLLQTLLETFAVDNRGDYPQDIQDLLREANKYQYNKKIVNIEDEKLDSLADNNSKIKGIVIYKPIKDKNGKVLEYKIFANDNNGNLLKDQNGNEFFLSSN
ncbi:MAG: WG repeat-containing protein [Cyanobacteriota bacterium]